MFNRFRKISEDTTNGHLVTYGTIDVPALLEYPSGTFIKTEKGYYYIKGGKRYSVDSERVLLSWRPAFVAPATEESAGGFEVAGRLGFRSGTLVRNIADGKTYLISDLKKRQILNPSWLAYLGAEPYDILEISDEEARFHADGEVLN